MKCPYCDKEIPGVTCPECNRIIPEDSRYCLGCGAMLEIAHEPEDDLIGEQGTDDLDLDSRIPCSDGNCIGIIINGKCNICGKRYTGGKK